MDEITKTIDISCEITRTMEISRSLLVEAIYRPPLEAFEVNSLLSGEFLEPSLELVLNEFTQDNGSLVEFVEKMVATELKYIVYLTPLLEARRVVIDTSHKFEAAHVYSYLKTTEQLKN